MYERFSDRARKVMQLANQEAQRFNHEYIGTEHILLGLVKEGSGVAAEVLKSRDVDLRKVRLEVEKIVQAGPDVVTIGKLPQTPRAKKVIEYAIEEARNLKDDHVGTEHLLVGLARETEGVAAQVLMNLGLHLNDLRQAVSKLAIHVTKRAREVVQLAKEEARRLRHEHLGSEHLLLGLAKEGAMRAACDEKPGVAAAVLAQHGIDLPKMRLEVEKLIPCGSAQTKAEPRSTPGLEKAMDHAMDEATNLQERHVGTGLLLLGLLSEKDGIAAQVLKNLGVRPEDIGAATRSLLSSKQVKGEKVEPTLTRTDPYAELADLPEGLLEEVKELDRQIERLNEQKEQAVAEQDFENAAHLRDQADKLKKHRQALIWESRKKE
jgi:ATP-dependent Clp protease ATP-binding subunit ClpA